MPASTTQTFYTYSYSGSRGSVNIHFSVLETLQALTSEGAGKGARWGLLLGKLLGDGQSVAIEAVEPAEGVRVAESCPALERWVQGPGRRIHAVGYYRQERNEDLSLSPKDITFVRSSFSGSALVWTLHTDAGDMKSRLWQVRSGVASVALDFPAVLRPDMERPAKIGSGSDLEVAIPTAVPPVRSVAAPPNEGVNLPATGTKYSGQWLWMCLIAIAGLCGTLGAYKYSRAEISSGTTPLGLDLEGGKSEVRLRWHTNSSAVAAASGAVLTVGINGVSTAEAIDLKELRTGSIVCSAPGTDVTLQLEVFGPKLGSVTESVRLLRSPLLAGIVPGTPK